MDLENPEYVYYYEDTTGKFGGAKPKKTTIDELVKYINSNIDVKNNKYPSLYEEISYGTMIKPYFDAEAVVDAYSESHERTFFDVHLKALVGFYRCDKSDIFCFCGSGKYNDKYKISYHFVVNNGETYKPKDIEQHIGKMKTNSGFCMFDESVYKKGGSSQKYRMPYAVKFGSDRVLQYVDTSGNGYKVVPWSHDLSSQYEYWLAQMPTSPEDIKRNVDEAEAEVNAERAAKLKEASEKPGAPADLGVLERAVMGLSEKYYTDREPWRNVIFALASMASKDNNAALLALAHKFSKQCPDKYDEDYVDSLYNKANKSGITKGTLYYYLKEDNPALFDEICAADNPGQKRRKLMEDALSGLDEHIPERYRNVTFDAFGDYTKLVDLGKASTVPAALVSKYVRATLAFIIKDGAPVFMVRGMERENAKMHRYLYKNRSVDKIIDNFRIDCNIGNPLYDKDKPTDKHNVRLFDKKGKLSAWIKQMHESSAIPTYRDVDFVPYFRNKPADPLVFNMFTGYPAARYIADNPGVTSEAFKQSRMFRHMREQMCAGDDTVFEYMMDWIAQMIQYPETRPGVNILIHGPQGNGKNTTSNFIKSVIGHQYSASYDSIPVFLQKHNSDQQGKLFMVMEEINDRGANVINHDMLKNKTDAPTLRVEPKFMEPYEIRNYARLMFLTNNRESIFIEPTDRRYCMIESRGDYCNDRVYFSALYKEINEPDMIASAFAYFAERDVKDFMLKPAPQTKYHAEQKTAGLAGAVRFLEDVVSNQFSHKFAFWNFDAKVFIVGEQELYAMYQQWCRDNGERSMDSKKVMLSKLAPLLPDKGRPSLTVGPETKRVTGYKIAVAEFIERMRKFLKSPTYTLTVQPPEDDSEDNASRDLDEYA